MSVPSLESGLSVCVGEASGCPNVLRRADCLAIAEVPAGTRETRRVGRMGALGVYAVVRVYSMGLASSGQRALGEMCHVPVSGLLPSGSSPRDGHLKSWGSSASLRRTQAGVEFASGVRGNPRPGWQQTTAPGDAVGARARRRSQRTVRDAQLRRYCRPSSIGVRHFLGSRRADPIKKLSRPDPPSARADLAHSRLRVLHRPQWCCRN